MFDAGTETLITTLNPCRWALKYSHGFHRGYFGHILFSFFGFYGGVFSWQIGLPIVWCGVGGGIELFGVAYCCNVRLGK